MKNPKLSDELADNLIEERIEAIRTSLKIKAREYTRDGDRMHNFNQSAMKSDQSREKCLAGFRLKHEVSIQDLRNDLDKGKLPTKEVVKEKYGDVINYFILEEMSILHRIHEEESIEIEREGIDIW